MSLTRSLEIPSLRGAVQKGSNDFYCFVFAPQPRPERNFGAPGLRVLGEIGIKRCLLFIPRSIMGTCACLRIAAFLCAGARQH
jgi:hypothetical protein